MSVRLGNIAAICLSLSLAHAAQEDGATLVQNGQPRAVIVVPPNAAKEVARGAEELQHWVRGITGATLSFATPRGLPQHTGQVKLHIGPNASISQHLPDLNQCEKDGAWLKTLSPQDVLIAGKTPYGTEFGVYGFLARYCGIRWYLPGPNGTHVPKKPTLAIPRIDLLDNPTFISRHFMAPTLHANVMYPCPAAQEMDLAWCRHNRLRKHFYASHNLGRIIVPSKLRQSHPEYFPRIGARRHVPTSDRPVGFQPCMTNRETALLCADAALRHFEANPDRLSFSIGINDWGGFCQCAACSTINGPARLNSRGLPDYSRLLFHFGNQVAAQLPARHPDRYVGMIAYAQARDLPPDTEVHANLHVGRVAAFTSYFSPMDRADLRETRRMAEACDMFGVYDYWYGSGYAIPLFCVGLMEEYVDWLAALGTRGWGSETYQNWSMDGIKYYLLAQKLWDPKRRAQSMLGEFCRDLFGAGASDMLEFYRICQERWETQTFATSKYHLSGSARQVLLFDGPTCDRLSALLTDAQQKTSNPDGRYLLDRLAKTIAYTQACARLLDHSLVLADSGSTEKMDEHGTHREEDVIPDANFRRPVGDLDAYRERVLAALLTVRDLEAIRTDLRRDAFTLPRMGLPFLKGIMQTPETIAAPLLAAYAKTGRDDAQEAFLSAVRREMPELLPKIEWVAQHLPAMAQEPELLPNGSFEEVAANRYDAAGWLHGNWGSKRSTANAFVVPQGADGRNCYYLVGVKNTFTYLPSPVIRVEKPVSVEAGKWYVARAKVRSHRNDGLLPEPEFQISFPGARRTSLSCSLSAGTHWFDALWLFQAPERAKTAIVRMLGTQGEGQTWVDAFSLKRVPDHLAPAIEKTSRLLAFPPLLPAETLPGPLVVDLAKSVPGRVSLKGQPTEDTLVARTGYDVLHVFWVFGAQYDLELRVIASSPDGATLGAYGLDLAQTEGRIWTKVGKQKLGQWRQTLGSEPQEFTFRYAYKEPCQKAQLILYRSNKQGTLRIHRVEVIPVHITQAEP